MPIIFVLIAINCFSQELITKFFKLNYIEPDKARLYFQKFLPQIKVEINPAHKLLIVKDVPENITKVEELLNEIDKRAPQVLINAKIVEVKITKKGEWGVNWSWLDLLSGSIKELKASLKHFREEESRLEITLGSLRTENFNAVLHFLLTKAKADLISSPSILTMDGKTAVLETGEEVPYPEALIVQAVTRYVTKFKRAGVILRVTPFVKEGGYIFLDIKPEVSEIIGYFEVPSPGGGAPSKAPIVATRMVQTSVVIKEGDTLMIGGLLQTKTLKEERGLPFPKNIPYIEKIPILGRITGAICCAIGYLLKKEITERIKTEIMIFITPKIIKEGEKVILPKGGLE